MLHKHSVIFRSIYYTGKLNKQIDNGPAELFSIPYSHLTSFTPCPKNCISFSVCLFLFFQTLIFRKKLSVAEKGSKVQSNLLLSYFAFGWV